MVDKAVQGKTLKSKSCTDARTTPRPTTAFHGCGLADSGSLGKLQLVLLQSAHVNVKMPGTRWSGTRAQTRGKMSFVGA